MAKQITTDVSVEKIKLPKTGQVDVRVLSFPGLYLRLSHGGAKTWSYSTGKMRLALGTYPEMTLAEAHEAWRQVRKEIKAGRDPRATLNRKPASTVFADVAEEWLRRDIAGNRTEGEYRRILKKDVLPAWGHLQIHEITRRHVLDLLDGIVDRGKPTMALRTYMRLHRLFAWAVKRGIVDANPVATVEKPAGEVRRDRVLDDKELVAVWRAAEQLSYPVGHAVRLLILTGARRDEIAKLRWAEIEDDTIHLKGERTKNGEPHDIPLSAPARGLLVEEVPRIGDYVLTFNGVSPINNWDGPKRQLDKISGLTGWRLHDLRRSLATGLQKLGVALQVTEAVLGHVSGSRAGVVGIYQRHDYAAEKRAALEAWGEHVMALVEGRETGVVLPIRSAR